MPWYDGTVQALEAGKVFKRSDLIAALRRDHPDLSSNSFQWAIGGLLNSGAISRIGRDAYLLSAGAVQQSYSPDYSEQAFRLIDRISAKFPHIRFTVFESTLLNEFLNHLIAQNTIFLQVEKDAAIFVFRFLQDDGMQNVLFKPSQKEFSLYWDKNSVVVSDLISESPTAEKDAHSICLEKMLVDIYCDKLVRTTYSRAEYESVFIHAFQRYSVDRTKLLRYARRRNKQAEITEYLLSAGKRE